MVNDLILQKNGANTISFVTARVMETGGTAPAIMLITPVRSYTCGLSKKELMDIRDWCTGYLEE